MCSSDLLPPPIDGPSPASDYEKFARGIFDANPGVFPRDPAKLPPQIDGPSPASQSLFRPPATSLPPQINEASPASQYLNRPWGTSLPPQINEASPANDYEKFARGIFDTNPGAFPQGPTKLPPPINAPSPASLLNTPEEPDLRRAIAARRVAAKHLVHKGYHIDFPAPNLKRAGDTLEGVHVKRKTSINPMRRLIRLFIGLPG